MKLFIKYWSLILVTFITLGLGVVVFLTTQKLKTPEPVAPNVPQDKPEAAEAACTLAFNIAGPTVTPLLTPSPTPTGTTNKAPECDSLSLEPSSGLPPLTVTLTCTGTDTDGDIVSAEFNYGEGDTETKPVDFASSHKSVSTIHIYGSSSTYTASCRMKDNRGALSPDTDKCKKTVSVRVQPTQPVVDNQTENLLPTTVPQTPQIPVSGSGPSILGITTIGLGAILLILGLAL